MYGDTDVIRGLARTMHEQGATLREEAERLLGRAERVPWEGLAAEAMRHRVRAQVAGLRRTAALADAAGDALSRHADEVDRRKALIASVEDRVRGLAGDLLGSFVPPPSGHRDWLFVHLPGFAA